MDSFEVQTSTLHEADALLGEAVERSRTALAQLRSDATEVLAGWEGSAATAFRDGFGQWLDGVHLMLDALAAMAHMLRAAGADYAATEQVVQASFAGTSR